METKGDRLKKLIKELGVTNKDFALMIKKNPNYISMLITGKKEINDKLLLSITKVIPNINKDWIEKGDGNIFLDDHKSVENGNGNKFTELPNGLYMMEVPIVPFKAYASFIEVYNDEYEIHKHFDSIYFTVDRIGRGKYIAFNTVNDSMNGGKIDDTPSGADVLGRELVNVHWKDGFNPTQYGWIIICHTGIFHKDISGPDEEGNIVCSSRNPSPEFPKFTLNLNEVHSIYKIIKRTF